jgi:hypothetical protein
LTYRFTALTRLRILSELDVTDLVVRSGIRHEDTIDLIKGIAKAKRQRGRDIMKSHARKRAGKHMGVKGHNINPKHIAATMSAAIDKNIAKFESIEVSKSIELFESIESFEI